MSTNPMEEYLNLFPPPEGFDKDNVPSEKSRIAARKLPIEDEFDLHGMTENDARDALLRFIEDSRLVGKRKILIIHGKGSHDNSEGRLKKMVRILLEEHPSIGATGIPDAVHGGSGARWAIVKSRNYRSR